MHAGERGETGAQLDLLEVVDDGAFDEHAGDTACYNVIWRSTRALLRRKPPTFYLELAKQVNVADGAEAVHFVERAVGAIFGDGYRPSLRRRCTPRPRPRPPRLAGHHASTHRAGYRY